MAPLLTAAVDAACDLLLGAACAGCGRPGRPWCLSCAAALDARVLAAGTFDARPMPAPPGLPPTWSAGPYDGTWREAVLAYKERGQRSLARPLGAALAGPLRRAAGSRDGVAAVPVPSSPAARRARGHDHVRTLLAAACGRGDPTPTYLLRWTRAGADQVGLDARERARNRHGALVARPCGGLAVVVVDDVVTTGATLAEAARALRAAGAEVLGGATVAATVRRRPPPASGRSGAVAG